MKRAKLLLQVTDKTPANHVEIVPLDFARGGLVRVVPFAALAAIAEQELTEDAPPMSVERTEDGITVAAHPDGVTRAVLQEWLPDGDGFTDAAEIPPGGGTLKLPSIPPGTRFRIVSYNSANEATTGPELTISPEEHKQPENPAE